MLWQGKGNPFSIDPPAIWGKMEIFLYYQISRTPEIKQKEIKAIQLKLFISGPTTENWPRAGRVGRRLVADG